MAATVVKNNRITGSLRETKTMSGRDGWRFEILYDNPGNALDPVAPGVKATRWTDITDSYINSFNKRTLEDGKTVILEIEAVPFRYLDKNTAGGGSPPETVEDDINKKYETREVFFPMEWFGVKRADSTDRDLGKIAVKTGAACTKEGDIVYEGEGQTSPDYTLCPYDGMPTISENTQVERDAIIYMIEARRPVLVYILTFFQKKNLSEVIDFGGVNPDGKKFNGSSDEDKYDPFDISKSTWKFISQEIIETTSVKKLAAPKSGYETVVYSKLKRVFERVPKGLTWHDSAWTSGDW